MRLATIRHALTPAILAALLSGASRVDATPFDGQPKILLHLATANPPGNACAAGLLSDCGTAVTSAALSGGLYDTYFIYLLAAPADTVPLGGIECGITYSGSYTPDGSGPGPLKVYSWTRCGTFDWQSTGWPAPGGGNAITWSVGDAQVGETVVAGYFYVGVYGPASMAVTRRPVSCVAGVADIASQWREVAPEGLGQLNFYSGAPVPGCNPCNEACTPVPLPDPQPPSGLTATPGCGVISLAWVPQQMASGYLVKRDGALLNGGNPVETASFVDTVPGLTLRCYEVATVLCGVVSDYTPVSACATAEPPVAIDTQPVPVTASIGASADFTVVASGAGTLTYRWRKNGVNLDDGPELSGSTTDHLELLNLDLTDEGNYSVVVTADCGTVTSTAVALTVCGQPLVSGLTAPSICTTVTLAWTPLAGVDGYRVERDGSVISGANPVTAAGFVDPSPPGGESCYRVASVKCSVTGLYSAPLCITPLAPVSIVTPPANQEVEPSATLQLSVTAAGSTPAYQWRKDGLDLSDGGRISGATTAQLTITDVSTLDAGDYTVLVFNSCNSVASTVGTVEVCDRPAPAGLSASSLCTDVALVWSAVPGVDGYRVERDGTVISGVDPIPGTSLTDPAPAVTEHCYRVASVRCGQTGAYSVPLCVTPLVPVVLDTMPLPSTVQAGTTASFRVVASGSAPLTYQWRRAGTNLSDGGRISGATTSQLTIAATVEADAGALDVIVSNPCGSITSPSALLTVCTQPVPGNLRTTSLCGAAALAWDAVPGAESYTLVRDGGFTVLGLTGTSYLDTFAPPGEHCYTVASVRCGTTGVPSQPLCVTPIPATMITMPMPPTTTLPTGGALSISPTVTVYGTPQYQWLRNGMALSDGGYVGGTTTASLTIGNLSAANGGVYQLRVINECQTLTSSPHTVLICTAPIINSSPSSQTRQVGQSVNFHVSASGTGLSYQWRHNGVNVGTNSSSLSISGLTASSAGYYDVVVTNTCSSVTSAMAYLTVNCSSPLVVNTAFPQNATIPLGAPLMLTARLHNSCTPITYQWRKEGVNIGTPTTTSSLQNDLVIPSVSPADAGYYSCQMTSAGGQGTSRTAAVNAPTIAILGLGASQSCAGIKISWTTSSSTTCVLHYGSTPGVTQTFNAGTGTSFSTTIPALATTVYYQVTSNSGAQTVVKSVKVPQATASNLVVTLITYPAYTNDFGAGQGIRVGIKVTNAGCGLACGTLQMSQAKLKLAPPRDPVSQAPVTLPRFIFNNLGPGQSATMPVEFLFRRSDLNLAPGSPVTFQGKLQWGGSGVPGCAPKSMNVNLNTLLP